MGYYTMPVCTPTRAAIMTGLHPIHNGLACGALLGQQRIGMPLRFGTLPEMLAQHHGYETFMSGKWHLGFFTAGYLPTRRGFSRFYGFLTGKEDYFSHQDMEYTCPGHSAQKLGPPFRCNKTSSTLGPGAYFGLDLYDGETLDRTQQGRYSTELFTSKAIAMLELRNRSRPAFLYLAYNGVHNANPADPLQAPSQYVDRFTGSIPCEGRSGNNLTACQDRRVFAGMLAAVDEGVGNLSKAVARLDMAENTLWVVVSDNGGPSDDQQGDSWNGIDRNVASNWPLRGKKASVWEGGTRVTAMISGAGITNTGVARTGLMHAADWLPTLLDASASAAAFPDTRLPPEYRQQLSGTVLDGVSAWPMLSKGAGSLRTVVLNNINEVTGSAGLRIGDWKLVSGAKEQLLGGWYDGITGLVRETPAVPGASIDCGASDCAWKPHAKQTNAGTYPCYLCAPSRSVCGAGD